MKSNIIINSLPTFRVRGGSNDSYPVSAPASDCLSFDSPAAPVSVGANSMPSFVKDEPGIAGFDIVHELGRGAFGRVLLARQRDMAGRAVVLKIGKHLREEIDTLAQLQHPNVVPVHSFHRDGDRQALCMPYVGSVTLANVVRHVRQSNPSTMNGHALLTIIMKCRADRSEVESAVTPTLPTGSAEQIPPTTAPRTRIQRNDPTQAADHRSFDQLKEMSYQDAVVWIGRQLSRGLAAAHDRKIIHSDLKPANILLADNGEPMLIDFGVAFDQKARDREVKIGGTRPYMSPEHMRSFLDQTDQYDHRSDIYSLGVILYELMTGRLPFPHGNGANVFAMFNEIEERQVIPRLNASDRRPMSAIESIIRTCLAPDPSQRYPSARCLETDLTRQLEHRPLAFAPNLSRRELATKWLTRNRRTVTAGLAASLVLCAGAMYERHDRQRRAVLTIAAEDRRAGEWLASLRERQIGLTGSPADREAVLSASIAPFTPAASLAADKAEQIRERTVDLLLAQSRSALNLAHGTDADHWRTRADEWNRQAGELAGPANRAVLTQRAAIERSAGLAAADETARLASETPIESALQSRREGQELMDQGRWHEAAGHLTQANDRNPNDFWAAFALGQCRYRMGRDAEAIAAYDRAAAIDPDVNGVYFNRGLASLRLRKFADAESDFTRVIEFKADWADPYLNRANAREAQGDWAGAIADLTIAMDRGASSNAVLLSRARVYAKAGKADLAARDREAGLATEPTDDRGYCARGGARMPGKGIVDPKAFEPALADFRKALELNPKSLVALQMIARIYSLTRENEKAIAALTDLLKLYPETADALSGRAMLYSREGDRTAAHADAIAALRVAGDNPRTVYQLAGVYSMTSRTTPDDAREALTLLASALRNGFGFEHLADDRELHPIRRLPEFERVVADAKRYVAKISPPKANP